MGGSSHLARTDVRHDVPEPRGVEGGGRGEGRSDPTEVIQETVREHNKEVEMSQRLLNRRDPETRLFPKLWWARGVSEVVEGAPDGRD